jgi:hypothetical protein
MLASNADGFRKVKITLIFDCKTEQDDLYLEGASWRHFSIKTNLSQSLKTLAEDVSVELRKEAMNGLKNVESLGVNDYGVEMFAGGGLQCDVDLKLGDNRLRFVRLA